MSDFVVEPMRNIVRAVAGSFLPSSRRPEAALVRDLAALHDRDGGAGHVRAGHRIADDQPGRFSRPANSGILGAMRALRPFLIVTDVGFLIYWWMTGLHLLPKEWAFKDYADPILVAWNWSFLPLDLGISATGFASLLLHRRGNPAWRGTAIASLTLTFCSGLQAVSFWAIRRDFDVAWWLPNLFLLLYPLFFLPRLLCVPGALR